MGRLFDEEMRKQGGVHLSQSVSQLQLKGVVTC